MNTALLSTLTDDETFTLTHNSMWGSSGYPLAKRGYRWFVDGCRGCGACPLAFRTKREAAAQWEAYIGVLCDRKAGRI